MTPKSRNRIILVVALLVAGAGLGAIAFGNMGQNLVYYWSPAELLSAGDKAYGATIRLGGLVQKGSVQWGPTHTSLTFNVAEGVAADAKAVKVTANETPPEMFREGIGVVCEGTYAKDGTFTSNRLIVKHSNEYRAPKAGEKGDDHWKESAKGADATASAGEK